MARKPNTRDTAVIDGTAQAGIDQNALASAGAAMQEQSMRIAVIDQQFGIGMPYHLDSFIHRIRQNATEAASRLVEVGLMLIQIRERETKDVFQDVLTRADISARFAQRTMQAAVKLADRPSIAALGSSKALELISEDDETLDILESGGSLAGHTIDELDAMTVRELKAAVREARQEKDAADDLVRAKDDRINKLLKDKKRLAKSSVRVQVEDLLADMDAATVDVIAQAKQLRDLRGAIESAYAEAGETIEEDVASRIEGNTQQALAWLREIDPDAAQ